LMMMRLTSLMKLRLGSAGAMVAGGGRRLSAAFHGPSSPRRCGRDVWGGGWDWETVERRIESRAF
jgi:hypothetical protein